MISCHLPDGTHDISSKESARGSLPCFPRLSHDIRFLLQFQLHLAVRTEITLPGLTSHNSSTEVGPLLSPLHPGSRRPSNSEAPRRYLVVRPAFEPKPCRGSRPQRLSVVTSPNSSGSHSCELSSVVGGILAPKLTSNLNFDVSCAQGIHASCSLCWLL